VGIHRSRRRRGDDKAIAMVSKLIPADGYLVTAHEPAREQAAGVS
jgi:hypothetical protein